MAEKRTREDSSAEARKSSKKQKRGFQVGPANLPDGVHKRKVQKIKQDLIHKAKLKKSYAKIRERELASQPTTRYTEDGQDEDAAPAEASTPAAEPASLELHADRQAMLEQPEAAADTTSTYPRERPRREKRPKTIPFSREAKEAQERREEAEMRRRAREEAQAERQQKLEERERFRRAMAKARTGGPNGQRKLGRESAVLLEKVQRLVGK